MKINELKRTSDLSKFPSLNQLLDPVRLLFDRTTVPQNPETPRGVMTVNKFTRDMYSTVCLFLAHAPQSVIIATLCFAPAGTM